MRPIVPFLALLIACGPGRQPPPPTSLLVAPADTITLSDTEIADAIWLGGERWALLAPQAKVVRLVDFTTGRSTPLGRPGVDYVEPFAIFRAGDTLYVNDWGKRRVTGWTLTGRLALTQDAPAPFRGSLPRGRDAEGGWYAELRPFPGSDGSGNLNEGAVVRWKEGATGDTVARLAPFQLERVTRNGATRYERLVLSGADQWGVRPDGSLWLARVGPNLLERCLPGHGVCTAGPPLPDRVLEVTLQDREYFLQSFPEDQRSLAEGIPFAIVKPPFDRAFAAPNGDVWLERSRMLTDSTRRYHRLGADGQALQEVRLPNAQRILAADSTHLLAIDPLVPGPGHRVLRYVIPK
jgi:hypothetical protein